MKPHSSARRLRVGIAGCGNVAEHHARFIRELPNAELSALAEVNLEAGRDFARRHQVPVVYPSAQELLDHAQLDVLHVVTPPAYHYSIAKTAVERGIHVFLEKPLTFTAAEIADLYERAERNRVLLCPDFIQLFHPQMQKLKAILESGKLGRVVHVEVRLYFDADIPALRESQGLHWSYRLPGGVLRDYSSHVLYLALALAGAPGDVQVIKKSSGRLPQALADHLTIQMECARATATVVLSCQASASAYGVTVFCEHGCAAVDFEKQSLVVNSRNLLPRRVALALAGGLEGWSLAWQSVSNICKYLSGSLVPYSGLRGLLPRFYGSILNSEPMPVPPALAISVTQVEEQIFAGSAPVVSTGQYQPARRAAARQVQRVLVTGAAGYVGASVTRALLEAGYYVRALVRPTARLDNLRELGVDIFFGDIRTESEVSAAAEGMDIIVHLAAGLKGSAAFVEDSSVRGTQNVANAALAHGIKRVLYMSSMSVYDLSRLRDGERIDVDSPLEQCPQERGAYSVGKRRAEDVALAHLAQASPAWTILRPSVIVGRGRELSAPIGIRLGSTILALSRPRNWLPLVHVDDVASAILVLLQHENTGGRVYTLSDPDQITMREYVRNCIRSQGKKSRVIYFPFFLAGALAYATMALHRLSGRFPRITPRRLYATYRNAGADSRALYQDTGWQPAGGLLSRLQQEAHQPGPDLACEVEQVSVDQ